MLSFGFFGFDLLLELGDLLLALLHALGCRSLLFHELAKFSGSLSGGIFRALEALADLLKHLKFLSLVLDDFVDL